MEAFESYQSSRFLQRLHAAAQVIIVLLILVALNYIGMRSYHRVDMTDGKVNSLSAETLAYLQELDRPIDVIVTLSEQSKDQGIIEILADVRRMLGQYEHATRSKGENRIKVEYINVFQQTRRARELEIDSANVIVFKSGLQQRTIFINELYSLHDDVLKEFLGESVFTSAILELSETEKPTLYFTKGHGELNLSSFDPQRGASQLLNALTQRNFLVKELDLSTTSAVPEDANLVVIAGPQSRFLPEEQGQLQSYLKRRSGRVMFLLEPGVDHGLDDLLYDWGILADKAIVVERNKNFLVSGGDLLLRRLAPHDITQALHDNGIYIVTDRAAAARADPGRPEDDSLVVTDLIETSAANSWGEKDFATLSDPDFNPSVDLPGPVRVAAISERKVDSNLGISIPGGKLFVMGTISFLSNNRSQASGNLSLALNAINFSLERNARLNIPPRPIEALKLDMSMEQLQVSRYLIWLGPPFLLGLVGLIIYLTRRS